MNRRFFNKILGAALAAPRIPRAFAQQTSSKLTPKEMDMPAPGGPPQQIGMLLYPGSFPLDIVGPYTFLSGLMNVQVHLLWKECVLLGREDSLRIMPTTTLKDCPRDLEVLFVPGGTTGTNAMLADDAVLDFLADRGSRAQYVTSVCTGSLILGAAGLLRGYRATSHWNTRDLLPTFDAIPVEERVVLDRNRITGGGVTSGIDFGLVLAAQLRGRQYAELLQLINEYDPQPPFRSGTPKLAGPKATGQIDNLLQPFHDAARTAALNARQRRHLTQG